MENRRITYIALMLSLLIVSAQFTLPIGIVPVTLQSFVILLIGTFLSPKEASVTTFLYLLIGLVGLPVFTNFNGGLHSIFLPTFGFIISWIPASASQAFYLKNKVITKYNLFVSFLLNYLISYIIGLTYMGILLNGLTYSWLEWFKIIRIGFLPFIIGDTVKILVAIILAKRLKKFIY